MSSESNPTNPKIADLPNEILEQIFSYLEFDERLQASQVCRRWYSPALQLDDIRWRVNSPDLATILASVRLYRHLILNSSQFASQLIAKFRASLKSLHITDVESWDWLGSLCGLPNLQSLHIKCNYRVDSLDEVPLAQPCPSLRWWTIEDVGSDVFPALNSFLSATCPELEYLKVEHFTGIFRLSNLPKLQHLEVIAYNELDDGLMLDIKALPNLRTMTLTGRRLACDYPEEVLHSDHIRTVAIGTDDPLCDGELLKLTEVFPGMTAFSFSRWTLCTVAGIEDARQKLPNYVFDVQPAQEPVELWSASDLEESSSETNSS